MAIAPLYPNANIVGGAQTHTGQLHRLFGGIVYMFKYTISYFHVHLTT
jgi:hypothetical protein